MHLSLTKRITVFVLLAALLLPLAACGKTENPPAKDPAVTSEGTAAAPEETEAPGMREAPNVARMDFGGNTFCTLIDGLYFSDYFTQEEIGEVLNDAIYSRNRNAEEYLNITWKYVKGDFNKLTKSVLAADDDYHHYIGHTLYGNDALVSGGYLYRVDDLPYVDYDAEWWDWENMDNLMLGKYHYFLISGYLLSTPYAIYINFDLIADNNMEDPYQLVYDGKWTLDKFIEMCEAAAHDTNGNGVMDDDDDTMGLGCFDPSLYSSFVSGCEQTYSERGESGVLEISMGTEKMQNIVEKMTALAKSPGAVKIDWTAGRKFTDAKTLFWLGSLEMLMEAGTYDFEVGFVPYPKFDEAQSEYCSLDWSALMSIPKTIQDPELVGAMMEYLAWESDYEVIPAYYDKTLGAKYAKDAATRDMLGFIMHKVVYDPGAVYFGMSGMLDHLYTIAYLCMLEQSTYLQSWLKVKQSAFKASLAAMNEGLALAEGD